MEIFQLVDGSGAPIGKANREECHGNPHLIHSVVHLHVFDPDGRLYLQKRSGRKDTNPGLWDTSVGGHVRAGESVTDALARESQEELAIDPAGAVFLFGCLFESPFESEYAHCFSLRWTGRITPDREEIEEGRFFPLAEVDSMIGTGTLTAMFEHEWPMLRAATGGAGRDH